MAWSPRYVEDLKWLSYQIKIVFSIYIWIKWSHKTLFHFKSLWLHYHKLWQMIKMVTVYRKKKKKIYFFFFSTFLPMTDFWRWSASAIVWNAKAPSTLSGFCCSDMVGFLGNFLAEELLEVTWQTQMPNFFYTLNSLKF